MHRMMEQEKEKAMSGTRHETQPVATIIYDNGSELTGTAVTTSDGSVGIRIPNEFFKTGLLADGSMPEGVKSVSIRPKRSKGGLPLTDDMVYMAVTAMLRDAVGLPLNEAADRYEAWLNRVRRAAIEKWVDSLPMREYEATKDLVATHVAGLLPGLDLAGQWSLDIMRDGDDYWLIDMAPAERSTFYEQAVPKGKRRPMMENWIPELGGKH